MQRPCKRSILFSFFLPSLMLLLLLVNGIPSFAGNPIPQSSKRAPVAPLSFELQGDLLMIHGRYQAALNAYQHASDRSAVLLNKIGIAYHHMLAFETAGQYYRQALAINPRFPEALNNLGAVYYSERDLQKAERTYKQALLYDPNSAPTLANLGITYFAEAKNQLAIDAYRKAVAIDPGILRTDSPNRIDEGASVSQALASNYSLAKICAAAGKQEDAMRYLLLAIQDGFHDRKRLMKDKQFAALRSTPEFQQFITQHADMLR